MNVAGGGGGEEGRPDPLCVVLCFVRGLRCRFIIVLSERGRQGRVRVPPDRLFGPALARAGGPRGHGGGRRERGAASAAGMETIPDWRSRAF